MSSIEEGAMHSEGRINIETSEQKLVATLCLIEMPVNEFPPWKISMIPTIVVDERVVCDGKNVGYLGPGAPRGTVTADSLVVHVL